MGQSTPIARNHKALTVETVSLGLKSLPSSARVFFELPNGEVVRVRSLRHSSTGETESDRVIILKG